MLMIIKHIKFNLFPSPEFKLFIYYYLSFSKDRNLSKKLLFINKVGHPSTITKRNISFSRHTFLPKKCTEWQNQSYPWQTAHHWQGTCHSIKCQVLTKAKFTGRKNYNIIIVYSLFNTKTKTLAFIQYILRDSLISNMEHWMVLHMTILFL